MRSRIEICMELLALCVVPKATYEIMTKLKLSWDTVNASVKFLVYKGLLHTDVLKRRRKRDGRALSATPVYVEKKVYCTTDAGREVVRLWLEFQRKLNEKDLNTRLINPLTNNIIRE